MSMFNEALRSYIFSEWIITECVVSVSVSRYRLRSISFCLDLDLTYVTTVSVYTDFQK